MLNATINRWWSVVAGFIGVGLGIGVIMTYAFGIIGQALVGDYGWPREMFANMMGAFLLGSGVGSVVLGCLVARYGIRPPSAAMILICYLGFAAIAVVPPVPGLIYAIFIIIGIAGAAATPLPYTVAVSGFFDGRRGLALGLVTAGSGFGAFLLPQFAGYLTGSYGWNVAMLVFGLGAGAISALGMIFLVRTPKGVVVSKETSALRRSEPAFLPTLLRTREFWFIALPIIAISILVFGTISSYVFLFADRQVSAATVTYILSFAGVASLFGRLFVGYLLDRIYAPHVTAVVFVLAAGGAAAMVLVPSIPVAFISAALIGLALGAEADILAFLVSRYFSIGQFSRVIGIIWIGWSWGGLIGTTIASQLYVATGSYTASFLLFALFVLMAAVQVCLIGPYRYPVHGKGQPAH